MSLTNTITEREKLNEIIKSLMESSFYLEMDIRERLALVKVMISTLS